MTDTLFRRVTDRVTDNVERIKNTILSDDADTDAFSDDQQQDGSRDRDFQEDASVVSTAIMEEFSPESVFEVGCGIGLHLKPFLESGITARGVDESDVAHENAVISTRKIKIRDLNGSYTPKNTYDLVICIDMLEYTSRPQEDTLIETIANAGETAVISVPLPQYSSLRYENEEPKKYWVQKFQEHGMSYDPEATRHLQERIDAAEEAWVPEQLMVFRQTD